MSSEKADDQAATSDNRTASNDGQSLKMGRSRPKPLNLALIRQHLPASQNVPSNAEATTSNDSTQHTFVVEHLERRIRDSVVRMSSCTSTPTSSEAAAMSRANSLPNILLTPDAYVLKSLENSAQTIATNVDVILRDLRGSLHGMSDLTLETIECYADAITTTCDSVDALIKNTYSMLAKVEELNGAMVGVKRLAQQVKEIKRVVDLFESHFTIHPS